MQQQSRGSIVVDECFLLFVRVNECVRVYVLVEKCTNQIQNKMIFYATFFSLCWKNYISSLASFSFSLSVSVRSLCLKMESVQQKSHLYLLSFCILRK